MESLTRGTHWSVDPTGQRDKTEHDGAARRCAAGAHRRWVRWRWRLRGKTNLTGRTDWDTRWGLSPALTTTAAAMADRRGGTTAVRRWRPRRSTKGRRRASQGTPVECLAIFVHRQLSFYLVFPSSSESFCLLEKESCNFIFHLL